MKIQLTAFTARGCALGQRLTSLLEEEGDCACFTPCRGEGHLSLSEWAALSFAGADALILIGATGIAVRAVAPLLKSKAVDPAVLVADEQGLYLIPLLSGHLGGANELALRLARLYGATPVLTTATDLRGVWAVDLWAKKNDCAILNPGRIKTISGRLLEGEEILLYSDFALKGSPSAGVRLTLNRAEAGAVLSLQTAPWTLSSPLLITPRIGVLGIGCRRGISRETLRAAMNRFLSGLGLSTLCLWGLASIELKAQEEGLCQLADSLGLPFLCFSAQALAALPGTFSASSFVQSTTGVDNVCERAALLASEGGSLYAPKTCFEGITFALALRSFHPSF